MIDEEETNKRGFSGWHIKVEWREVGLTWTQCILLAEIKALQENKHGFCWKTNAQFAEGLGLSEAAIKKAMQQLDDLNLIQRFGFDGRIRKITVDPILLAQGLRVLIKSHAGGELSSEPLAKKVACSIIEDKRKVKEKLKRENSASKRPLSKPVSKKTPKTEIAAKLSGIDEERLLLLKNHWAFLRKSGLIINQAAMKMDMDLAMNHEIADVKAATEKMTANAWIRLKDGLESIKAQSMYPVLGKHRNHPQFESFVAMSLNKGAESRSLAEQFAAKHIDAMIVA